MMSDDITQVDAAALVAAELTIELFRRLIRIKDKDSLRALIEGRARATIGMIIREAADVSESPTRFAQDRVDTFWSQTMAVLARDVLSARVGKVES